MAIEMSNPWIAGPIGLAAGAVLAWIATEYKNRKRYRKIIDLLMNSADDLADKGEVDKAMSIYEDILRYVPHPEPSVKGRIQLREGTCRYNQSFEGATESNLEKSIQSYKDALKVYDTQDHPAEHAQIQNRLGQVHFHLSQIKDEGPNLRQAIFAYEEALKFQTPGNRSHAEIENNLGDAYSRLAAIGNGEGYLNKAISAYEVALKFRTIKDYPEDYAQTQSSLGQAYAAFSVTSAPESDSKREELLTKAIKAYEAVLNIWTLEAQPEKHAETQNNLGDAHRLLAQVFETQETDTPGLNAARRVTELENAVSSYEEALKIRTLESAPGEYAKTQSNLGQTYAHLAEIGASDPTTSETAATRNLKNAISSYEEALKVQTLESDPEGYAKTQNNLGQAYRRLSEHENREENMNRALKSYEEALKPKSEDAPTKPKMGFPPAIEKTAEE